MRKLKEVLMKELKNIVLYEDDDSLTAFPFLDPTTSLYVSWKRTQNLRDHINIWARKVLMTWTPQEIRPYELLNSEDVDSDVTDDTSSKNSTSHPKNVIKYHEYPNPNARLQKLTLQELMDISKMRKYAGFTTQTPN